jgi:hypothetical protein
MQTTSFTPGQELRFQDICAWCANGCTVFKDEQGNYMHFPKDRTPCEASNLRKQMEKKPLDRMQDAWNAEACPNCDMPKRKRKDWFCIGCWRKLPRPIQNVLAYWSWKKRPPITQWLQACAILKQEEKQAETTGTNG